MTMLISRYIATLILFVSGFTSVVQAQDILSTTGQTVRSYNYVEGFYLLNLEDDLPDGAEVDLPALFRLSIDLQDKISVRGEYLNQSYDITADGQSGEFDVLVYELGLRYRSDLANMPNTDWIAGISYGIIDLEISSAGVSIGDSSNYYGLYAGGRRTLTDRLEFELGISFTRSEDGGSFSGTGDAALVYRVASRLDIALGATSITDGDNYGIGLRYTWK